MQTSASPLMNTTTTSPVLNPIQTPSAQPSTPLLTMLIQQATANLIKTATAKLLQQMISTANMPPTSASVQSVPQSDQPVSLTTPNNANAPFLLMKGDPRLSSSQVQSQPSSSSTMSNVYPQHRTRDPRLQQEFQVSHNPTSSTSFPQQQITQSTIISTDKSKNHFDNEPQQFNPPKIEPTCSSQQIIQSLEETTSIPQYSVAINRNDDELEEGELVVCVCVCVQFANNNIVSVFSVRIYVYGVQLLIRNNLK
jgi:hypothetical protein